MATYSLKGWNFSPLTGLFYADFLVAIDEAARITVPPFCDQIMERVIPAAGGNVAMAVTLDPPDRFDNTDGLIDSARWKDLDATITADEQVQRNEYAVQGLRYTATVAAAQVLLCARPRFK